MSGDAAQESSPGWAGRVAFSEESGGVAYRPDELLVGGERGLEVATRVFPSLGAEDEVFPGRATGQFYRMRGDVDPVEAVHELRLEGVVAQPNHVLFAHGECGCGPHPAQRWAAGLQGSPFYASPFYASPFYASPFYASPFYASAVSPSPFYASELRANGRRRSSARPAEPPSLTLATYGEKHRWPRVVVLDTGFAAEGLRPAVLAWIQPGRADWERPDEDQGGFLDPAGGHGTYICGLLAGLARESNIVPVRVLSTMGDGDEATIAARIDELAKTGGADLLNLSFGGYTLERPHVLAAAVRRVQSAGTVVVASAGNDATCRPTYPASLPGVVGVGALGPGGPAPFTNYGRWVRACAPGVDVVAPFFSEFIGDKPTEGGIDPDDFHGWARWSGTSFAAPAVVAALAREMHVSGVSAKDAVARVVDAPSLLRIPDLGTVVNIQ